MGKAQRHVGVLFGQQEGHAFVFVETLDDAENLFDQLGCQPHAGFIQQNGFRRGHQGAAKGGHLLFAARGIARLAFAALFEAREIVIDLFQVGQHGTFAVLAGVIAGQQVFLDREVLKTMAPLHHLNHPVADHLGRVTMLNLAPVIFDRALGYLATFGMQQVRYRLERG